MLHLILSCQLRPNMTDSDHVVRPRVKCTCGPDRKERLQLCIHWLEKVCYFRVHPCTEYIVQIYVNQCIICDAIAEKNQIK